MNKKGYIPMFIAFLLLLFIAGVIGCGGGSNTVMTVIPTPTSNDGSQILSTLTEISSTSNTISSTQGGTITHDKLTVEFPPGSLPSDSVIKIALVTINSLSDNTQHQGYKISTDSPDKVIKLKEPAVVRLHLDLSASNPTLIFWDGYEWLPMESSYESNTQEMSVYLKFIDRDINQAIHYGGELGTVDGPTVINAIGDNNKIIANSDGGIIPDIPKNNFVSAEGHFKVYYNNDEGYAKSITDILEQSFDYYKNLGFNAPVTFYFRQYEFFEIPPFDPESEFFNRINIYILPRKNNEGGWAHPHGYIKIIEGLSEIDQKHVPSHELFHLIQDAYTVGNRELWGWMLDSTATAIQHYTFNHYFQSLDYYDCKESEYDHYCKDNAFTFSLNNTTDEHYPYRNFIFWAYILQQDSSKPNKFKSFIEDNSYDRKDLRSVNSKCLSTLGESLESVYFKAFEDYYIYGKVFNARYFTNFSDPFRPPDSPFNDFPIWYNPNTNNNSKEVNLEHLSGKCLNFEAGNRGIFHINITELPSNTVVKLFKIKKGNNQSAQLSGEVQLINNKATINNFGIDITNVYMLLENHSLEENKKVTFTYRLETSDPNTPQDPNTPSPPTPSIELLSKSIPDGTTISPSLEFTQTYTFKNGSTTLNNCRLYFDGGDKMNTPDSISLPSSISPGQEFSVDIKMTAPTSVGTCTNYWQIKDSSGNKLGPQVSTEINCTADYMGTIVEQSPNPTLNLYQTQQITVKIRNTGTKPWNPGEVRLGTYNPQDRGSHFSHPNNSNGLNPDWLSDNRVKMQGNSTVQPGQIATFIITITDGWNPSSNGPRLGKGNYREEFKLVKDIGTPTGWFLDDNLSWDITVTDPIDYYCCWISQSPHPTVAKGGTKEITVKFKNLGKTAWNPSTLHLGADRPQDRNCGFYTATDSRWINTNRIKMVETLPVQTGQDANFTFTITGNPPNGTYPEYFRLVAEGIQWFNEPDNVGLHWNITVGDAGGAVIVVDKKGGK